MWTPEIRLGIDLVQGSGQSNAGAVICPAGQSHPRDRAPQRVRGGLAIREGGLEVEAVYFLKRFYSKF